MVATRRQGPKGCEEDVDATMPSDPELVLTKKPVRKGSAKTGAKAEPKTKARTTRGKKVEIDPEPEIWEDDPLHEPEPAKVTKEKTTRARKAKAEAVETDTVGQAEPTKPATRKIGARSKKDTTVTASAAVEDETIEPAKPTRATKAGSVRGKKAAVAIEEPPSAPAPEESKAGRATKTGSVRGRKPAQSVEEPTNAQEEPKSTRSTKAGSARSKKVAVAVNAPELPAPEAPKQTRQTRAAATKPQPLSPKKITRVSKPATRLTRNVNQKPAAKATQPKPPPKARGAAKNRTVSDENADVPDLDTAADEDGDVVMLSTTPVKKASLRNQNKKQDSAVESEASMSSRPTTPNDSTMQSLGRVDEENEQTQENESEAEATDKEDDTNASDDELCGPKTPMKRASPGAVERYHSSAQRTIRKYEDAMRKETPAKRFAVLGSQRGTPQTLKPHCKPAPPASDVRPMTVARGTSRALVFKDLRDGAPEIPQGEVDVSEEAELSFIPDDDIIPIDDDDETPTPAEATLLQSPAQSVPDAEFAEPMGIDSVDEETFVAPAAVQNFDDEGEETVLIPDEEDEQASPTFEAAKSFETEDTVLITRSEQDEVDEAMLTDENESDNGSVIISPARASDFQHDQHEQFTIAVNFEEHLSDVRHSSVVEEHTGFEGEEVSPAPMQDEQDAAAGAEMEVDIESSPRDEQDSIAEAMIEVDKEAAMPEAPSRRETVNFNDFFDVAALAEPTEVLNITDAVAESPAKRESYGAQVDTIFQTNMEMDVVPEVESEAAEAENQESPDTTEPEAVEVVEEPIVPHYALPTLSFNARRKSLPAFIHRTPVKVDTRPNTSDGHSMPRIANPFTNAWWSRSRANSTTATPVKAWPSTSHATPSAAKTGTPAKALTPKEASSTPKFTPKERYPVFAPRQDYSDHANTVAAPVRFQSPAAKSPKRRETFHKAVGGRTSTPATESNHTVPTESHAVATPQATPRERYPRLRSQQNYEDHAKTAAAPVRFQTPTTKSPKRRETFHKAIPGNTNTPTIESDNPVPTTPDVVATPQAGTAERYPRLRPRQDYAEHAKTAGPPVRFQTPTKAGVKRPATAQKPDSLRKAALKSNTPMKAPLKGPATIPAQEPLTPHPAAPLRSVVALVEVFTLEGASASAPFVALLHRLGAKTTRTWNDRVTHVIFKDGSPTTLQRVRLHNKEEEEKGTSAFIHCVNSRWVTDCDTEGARMDESDDAYAVDVEEVPRGGKRRRKSMEPSALMNLGGNIVRDRKSSAGRNPTFGRSPWKFDSPAKHAETPTITPEVELVQKENSPDGEASPVTPAWIAAPEQLVQQTAPMNRVRKLELKGEKEAKSRRLTFWNGGSML